jgi:HlyD family secretion protein
VLAACLAVGPLHAEHTIGALGRLAPSGGVIHVTGPERGILAEWHAAPGEQVAKGQLLATLTTAPRLAEALAQAERQRDVLAALWEARVKLQSALAELEKVRLASAESDLESYAKLQPGTATQRELQRRRGTVAESKAQLQAERLRLDALRAEGALEMEQARARIERARGDLEAARIVAPVDGTILALDRVPGEAVGRGALLRMADLARMDAECEVFAGDLVQIRPGQVARVVSDTVGLDLVGRVIAVSRIVDGQRNLGSVTVRLEQPETAARVIGMEVQVTFVHDG